MIYKGQDIYLNQEIDLIGLLNCMEIRFLALFDDLSGGGKDLHKIGTLNNPIDGKAFNIIRAGRSMLCLLEEV